MFGKFIFAIAWIGIFVLSLGGIYIGIFPSSIKLIPFGTIMVRGIFIGVSLIYILLFVEKLIKLFERPKELIMKTPNGVLKISSTSVNNIVKEVLGEHTRVKNLKVKNKTNGKKLKVFVSIDIMSSQSLSNELSVIQNDIKERIENYLDLNITDIELRVTKIIKDKNKDIKVTQDKPIEERGE